AGNKFDAAHNRSNRTEPYGRTRSGVCFTFQSMEQGATLRSRKPKFATADPNYQILSKCRSRFTHYYFYAHGAFQKGRRISVPSGSKLAQILDRLAPQHNGPFELETRAGVSQERGKPEIRRSQSAQHHRL